MEFDLPALQSISVNVTNTYDHLIENGDCKLETVPKDETTTYKTISDDDSDKTIYSDDEIPVAETNNIEIVATDEEEEEEDNIDHNKEMACISVDEPLMNLLSPIPSHYENFISSKSPLTSLASDYGYESHGSPNSEIATNEFKFESLDLSTDDPWNSSLIELFPSLNN